MGLSFLNMSRIVVGVMLLISAVLNTGSERKGAPKGVNAVNAVEAEADAVGLSPDVLEKFEDLLNSITKAREGDKTVDDKLYIQWGKTLETIVVLGNKSMVASAKSKNVAGGATY